MVKSRVLELTATDTSEPDGFARQYFGVRGEQSRVVVKRIGGDPTQPLPERLEELLDALGLAHGCEATVLGDGAESGMYWRVRLDGEAHTFRAPFDDEAIELARDLRRQRPPRGYAAAKDASDLSVGKQITVNPTGRNQILGKIEMRLRVATPAEWDAAAGVFKVDLADARGNVGPWLLRDHALRW